MGSPFTNRFFELICVPSAFYLLLSASYLCLMA
jgi:hypothetical protein